MTKKQQLIELVQKKVKQIIEEQKKKSKKKKATLEGLTVESHKDIRKDDLGRFYVVTSPSKDNMSENLVFETDLFNFTEKVQNGSLKYENIRGIFHKQESANRLKERLVRERTSMVNNAKKSADKLKNLKDEVITKAGNLKKVKAETAAAVQALQEALKKTPKKVVAKKKK